MMEKVSLQYLQRMVDDYELTLEEARELYGDRFEIVELDFDYE